MFGGGGGGGGGGAYSEQYSILKGLKSPMGGTKFPRGGKCPPPPPPPTVGHVSNVLGREEVA